MKDGFIHVCFVIDESGSMYGSTSDVLGGFKKVVDEQKANDNGSCSISLFKFNDTVKEVYIGKDINEIDGVLDYGAHGCTAMNDGIGTAIDKVGKWLSDMNEEDRPEKNLVVIMTDGAENASREYSISRVRDMIKEQTEKYNWSFMYLGTDITDVDYADSLGVAAGVATRGNYMANYDMVSGLASGWRDCSGATYETKAMAFCAIANDSLKNMNEEYEKESGISIKSSVKIEK